MADRWLSHCEPPKTLEVVRLIRRISVDGANRPKNFPSTRYVFVSDVPDARGTFLNHSSQVQPSVHHTRFDDARRRREISIAIFPDRDAAAAPPVDTPTSNVRDFFSNFHLGD